MAHDVDAGAPVFTWLGDMDQTQSTYTIWKIQGMREKDSRISWKFISNGKGPDDSSNMNL